MPSEMLKAFNMVVLQIKLEMLIDIRLLIELFFLRMLVVSADCFRRHRGI